MLVKVKYNNYPKHGEPWEECFFNVTHIRRLKKKTCINEKGIPEIYGIIFFDETDHFWVTKESYNNITNAIGIYKKTKIEDASQS